MTPLPQPGVAALDWPLYDASPEQAFGRFWKKYATFTGRASRSEFWWWYLITVVISVVLSSINLAVVGNNPTVPIPGTDPWQYVIDSIVWSLKTSIASTIWSLATLVGQIAITVRRLHDTNRSGWWYLLAFIPIVGAIILIVFCADTPRPEGQHYDRR